LKTAKNQGFNCQNGEFEPKTAKKGEKLPHTALLRRFEGCRWVIGHGKIRSFRRETEVNTFLELTGIGLVIAGLVLISLPVGLIGGGLALVLIGLGTQ
jgi:hypothetical protein